jgi:hypothetical protein
MITSRQTPTIITSTASVMDALASDHYVKKQEYLLVLAMLNWFYDLKRNRNEFVSRRSIYVKRPVASTLDEFFSDYFAFNPHLVLNHNSIDNVRNKYLQLEELKIVGQDFISWVSPFRYTLANLSNGKAAYPTAKLLHALSAKMRIYCYEYFNALCVINNIDHDYRWILKPPFKPATRLADITKRIPAKIASNAKGPKRVRQKNIKPNEIIIPKAPLHSILATSAVPFVQPTQPISAIPDETLVNEINLDNLLNPDLEQTFDGFFNSTFTMQNHK